MNCLQLRSYVYTPVYMKNFYNNIFSKEFYDTLMKSNIMLFEIDDWQRIRIGTSMIQYFIKEIQKGVVHNGKNTFYIMDSAERLLQRAKICCLLTGFKVGYFKQDFMHDVSSKESWEKHLENYEVLFVTTDVYLDAVSKKFIEIQYANTIIIDSDSIWDDGDMDKLINKFIAATPSDSRPRFLVMSTNYPCRTARTRLGKLRILKWIFNAEIFVTEGTECLSLPWRVAFV